MFPILFILFATFLSPPLQDILDLFDASVETTEELWMQKGKERWEFDNRYEAMQEAAYPLFEKAGLIFEKEPTATHYTYVLLHGALLSRVQERMDYLVSLIKKGIS